ncbi:sulfotransferase family protein [Actinoplanes sp. L3-i22]|nr:sulfotransferase family protein [Actinoplanes sp. L3-i22]
MLGQHPQLYGLPETHFFTCDSIDEWTTTYRGTDRMDGALRAVAQLVFGGQTQPTVRLARRWLQARSFLTTAEVLRLLARRAAPRVLVEKTPTASRQIQAVRRMRREFPRARFLHLVRHPHDQVRSRLQRRLDGQRDDGPASLAEAADRLGEDPAQLWYATHQAILRFFEEVPAGQRLRVRGEELLAEPAAGLGEIAAWLGLRGDDEAIDAMRHPERSPFAGQGPPNAPRGGDEKFFHDPVLRERGPGTPPLDAPLPWRPEARLPERVRGLARTFGYR